MESKRGMFGAAMAALASVMGRGVVPAEEMIEVVGPSPRFRQGRKGARAKSYRPKPLTREQVLSQRMRRRFDQGLPVPEPVREALQAAKDRREAKALRRASLHFVEIKPRPEAVPVDQPKLAAARALRRLERYVRSGRPINKAPGHIQLFHHIFNEAV